ncbi:gastrula zinc finger protein xFG20-1-like [Condylostylus longicornis]|uniref:gastrula zinc finger protein xFG20-1-like n=1 Tax=Condylostylus longicornis TaxID=2530218 RepID=UPI00244DC994|nr:gastrula zinc finger protein xFG20-1-like [Condylostylus longicornis]
MSLNAAGDNQIVKFKISIQNLKQEINDGNDFLKEKCGEINITNNGIFEIKCSLCGIYFTNVRSFAKHVLQNHYHCNNDSTIDAFMELNHHNTIDMTKTESHQILQDKNLSLEEQKPLISNEVHEKISNLKNDNMTIEENKVSMENVLNMTENSMEDEKLKASDITKRNITGYDSSCDSESFPSNEHKGNHDIEKVELLNQLSSSSFSKEENDKNLDQNDLDSKDSSFKNLKIRKTKSVNALNEKPICKICGKQTAKYKMRQHLRSHDNSRFLYQSRLNEHVAQHIIKLRKETGLETSLIANGDSLQCSFEEKYDPSKRKKFKQKQIIKAQRKPKKVVYISKPIEKIICDICGKETPKTNMKQHLRSHDSSRYTHKCNICTKLFISEKSLNLHIKNLHIKNRPFACTFEHCEKRFVNEIALKSHAIRHTSPRQYKCETCNKSFIYQHRLEEHIKIYHVNGRIFKCETCEKRFFDKHTLERHQVVHSAEKPFICDECPAKFSRERSLQWHKKSHTGIKDYICKICGKKYALYNGIYSHMKVHGIKYSMAYEKGLTDGKIESDEQVT